MWHILCKVEEPPTITPMMLAYIALGIAILRPSTLLHNFVSVGSSKSRCRTQAEETQH